MIWSWKPWYTAEEIRELRAGDIGKERKRIILEPLPEEFPVEEPLPEAEPAVAEPVPA
jgi:hypothetical protein